MEHRVIVATGFGFKGKEKKTYLERLTPSIEDSKCYLFFRRKWNPWNEYIRLIPAALCRGRSSQRCSLARLARITLPEGAFKRLSHTDFFVVMISHAVLILLVRPSIHMRRNPDLEKSGGCGERQDDWSADILLWFITKSGRFDFRTIGQSQSLFLHVFVCWEFSSFNTSSSCLRRHGTIKKSTLSWSIEHGIEDAQCHSTGCKL